MGVFLLKSKVLFLLLFFTFSCVVKAQCTITGTVNSNSLSCISFSSCSIINIGDGANPASLAINGNLDLTTCSLNPIHLIVNNNANIDFSVQNYDLRLPAGSSITFMGGANPGTLLSASTTSTDCTASDRIIIGGNVIASCSGTGPGNPLTFGELVAQGGYNPISVSSSPTSVCGSSGSFTFTASASPSNGVVYKWYSQPSGGTSFLTANTYSPTLTTTTTYYVEAVYSTYTTTPRKSVTAIVNPIPTIIGALSVCLGSTTSLTGSGIPASINPWTSSSSSVATVNDLGVVTALTSGTSTITYKNSNGCTVQAILAVIGLPSITTQPINQLDCDGSIVNFKVVAAGTGLNYTWQRKLPGGVFVNIPEETNITYPSPAEIRIDKVGLALSLNGTQYQVIISNGNCTVTSNPVTLSVNEIKSISSPVLSPAQSIVNVKLCSGANYSYSVVVSNPSNGNVKYKWKRKGPTLGWIDVVDGAHFSGADKATLNIIAGTPAESGNYRVDVVFDRNGGTCSVSSSVVRLLTFYPPLTIATGIITQPNCVLNTGAITITVQSVDDMYSFDNGGTYQSSNVKPGLSPGIINVLIKNVGSCISTVATFNINAALDASWKGTWTNGPPTILQAVIFNGDYSSVGDLEACSCLVNSGAVTINPGHSFKIANGVTVAGGTLTFEDKASLVQVNDSKIINAGNIIYKRTTTPIYNTDYTYWSSPVADFTLGGITAGTLYYELDASGNKWIRRSSAFSMKEGVGYIVRGAGTGLASGTPFVKTATFLGVANNGVVNVPIAAKGTFNLIGNPYPSAIDADLFLVTNKEVLDGTLYFWTHNTTIQLASGLEAGTAGSGTYAYTSNDYASYNLTGGTATSKPSKSGTTDNNRIPSGKIAAGQSFMATAYAAGTATFNNAMRLDSSLNFLNNTQFFKQTFATKEKEEIEKSRVWVNLSNAQGVFKQILIGYLSGATNCIDRGYDGVSYDRNKFIDFYSMNEGTNLTIQGRALPFNENDLISVGYSTAISGDFSISIDQVDGLFLQKSVYLKDKMTAIIHDLSESAYNFKTELGRFNDRFVLSFTNETLAKSDFKLAEKGVKIVSKNKEIKIISSVQNIDSVIIYDLLGRQIYKKVNINNKDLIALNIVSPKQTLVVMVVLEGGETFSKKIIH